MTDDPKEQLPALTLTGSNRKSYFFSRLLVFGLITVVLFIVFAPWRQFVTGSGRVIAFNPLDRRVNIEAPIEGRIRTLNVVEGETIAKGEIIVEIEDNDPNLRESLKAQQEQLTRRLETERQRLAAVTSQMEQQKLAKNEALKSARENVAGAKIEKETAELNQTRIENLFEKGLESRRNLEAAILRLTQAEAALKAAQADLVQTEKTFDSTIAATLASVEGARGNIASAERDLSNIEITVNRTARQVIKAPRDSIVLSVPVTDGSYLKPGSLVCVLIPKTESRFVEIMVDGNDMPLIEARRVENGKVIPGSPVRLAFEGWPSIQAIGWPQLAIGTFGGEVIFVDATDNGTGKFRIVVGPGTDVVDRGAGNMEVPWPDHETWLRQGVRARAWMMLDEVPLWFEFWRQINGFPPIGTGVEEADPTRKP